MAQVHVANIGPVLINDLGGVVDKDTMTIGQRMVANNQDRVLPDTSIPNTATSPTLKKYLELEAAQGFILYHLSQNLVITYNLT